MKRKTATITFHAAHNYGSMLQAYALQNVLTNMGVDNEIINFRSPAQKSVYSDPDKKVHRTLSDRFKDLLIRLIIPSYKKSVKYKYERFEEFLNKNLTLTKEYSNGEDLKDIAEKYDYFITGSDQCWNTTCRDFDWAYYLTFTDSSNKIGYATSLGPMKPNTHFKEISEKIEGFKAISAREDGTARYIGKLIGQQIPVMPDPTLLLPKDNWEKIMGAEPLIKQPYIFLYAPYYQEGLFEYADKIAKILKLPIVLSNITRYRKDLMFKIKHPKTIYKLDVGPTEFLNLIYNAELVISGSFHAILFSMIFKRPFFAFNGLKDNRMKHVLEKCKLTSRAFNSQMESEEIVDYRKIQFSDSLEWIKEQRNNALAFLRYNLEIG